MKKKLALSLAAMMTMSTVMTGCGSTDTQTTQESQPANAEVTQTKVTSAAEVSTTEVTVEETTQAASSAPDTATADDTSSSELTALELTKLMGNGINLGNTMEAYGHTSIGVKSDPTVYEQLWGQPVTTQEMIQGMKDAGFDSLRVPVAWTNMMDFENGDYTINEAYLARVGEIIDYAHNADMYVVVNDHWDGGWWGMFGSAKQETRDKAMEMYKSMWTQIATYYADHGDYLIFESANEELGNRLNDHDASYNADSGNLTVDECYTIANTINQTFVDVIRSCGGNNDDRFLLIAGFDTNITNTCDDRYQMPTDTVPNKLILSVHYYDPSGYCIGEAVPNWGTKVQYEEMNASLAKLTKFTDAGYGVIIGEYGVLLETGTMKENTYDYYVNFLSNCDYYNICPMLWDCNNLYNRNTCKMIDDQIAKLYLDHRYSAQKDISDADLQASSKAAMDAGLANASEGTVIAEDTAYAWLMYTSSDWAVQYRVGDDYPDGATAGLGITEAEITSEGTYTVGLDFTGTSGGYASGATFAAIGILHGEELFPGYVIDIKEVLINGEPYTLKGNYYTTSDDGSCTRVNLYNAWVPYDETTGFLKTVPEGSRTTKAPAQYCSPVVLDAATLGNLESIMVTFEYRPK